MHYLNIKKIRGTSRRRRESLLEYKLVTPLTPRNVSACNNLNQEGENRNNCSSVANEENASCQKCLFHGKISTMN